MTEIYIVRHCESIANCDHSFAGRTDADISERGSLQLEYLAEYFKDIRLDKIYTSSLIRARKTAEAINRYSSAPIEIEDRFIEIDLGELDGRPVSEMTQEQKHFWTMRPHEFMAPKGEKMGEVAVRAMEGLKWIAQQNPSKKIAVASHGCAIRNMIRVLKGLEDADLLNVEWCDNTGVNKVVFLDDGSYKIEFENYNEHLKGDAKAIPVSAWTKE